MTQSAKYWIDRLELKPHPEGGHYVETYRCSTGSRQRAASTAIYFLLQNDEKSHLHRIDADEMWHFYQGDPLTVHMIHADGRYESFELGPDHDKGQVFQAVVPRDIWFGAELTNGQGYALVGCTVSPGFEFTGFELAERESLERTYPQHVSVIRRLTPRTK